MNWKNILSRAAWTAAQAFLGYISAEELVAGLPQEWRFVIAAAIATALSAAKTFVTEKLNPTVS